MAICSRFSISRIEFLLESRDQIFTNIINITHFNGILRKYIITIRNKFYLLLNFFSSAVKKFIIIIIQLLIKKFLETHVHCRF